MNTGTVPGKLVHVDALRDVNQLRSPNVYFGTKYVNLRVELNISVRSPDNDGSSRARLHRRERDAIGQL